MKPTRRHAFQLNEGRLGSAGQAVNRTINHPSSSPGASTPWAWNYILIDALGRVKQAGRSIFPTLSIYVNGRRVEEFSQDLSGFIPLSSSYQIRKGEIRD